MNTKQLARSTRILAMSALAAAALTLAGCSGSASGGNAKGFVTILPGPVQVGTGGSLVIYAESTPTNVTWSIAPGTGCTGTGCGTLTNSTTTSVLYNGPVSIPGASATFIITATSVADPSIKASHTYTIFPVSVQVAAVSGSATVPPLTSAQFNASVTGDPTTAGVSWSLAGANCSGAGLAYTNCGTLSNATQSSVVYTAPAAPQLESINLIATSVQFPGTYATFAITVPKLNVYQFSPATLPPAIGGQPYSQTVQVSGNTPTYTFTPENLPSWAKFTSTGTSFTIAGTPPVAAETSNFLQVDIDDSGTPSAAASKDFALTVYPAAATGNQLLKGQYAFYGSGWQDSTVGPNGSAYQGIAYVGSFTADGNGNIIAGSLDTNNFQTGLTSYTSLGGTYNIQYQQDSNGNPYANFQTGYITLLPPGNARPITLAVTFRGIRHAATPSLATDLATAADFIEFDDTTGDNTPLTQTSSGQRMNGAIALQNGVAGLAASPFNGNYAFGLTGTTAQSSFLVNGSYSNNCFNAAPAPTCGPLSVAGIYNISAAGAVTAGEEDVQVGTSWNQAALGSMTGAFASKGATDANGRMTANIPDANAGNSGSTLFNWPSNYIMYAVDAQHFFVMSSDSFQTNANVIGTATYQQPRALVTPFNLADPVALMSSVVSTQYYTATGQGPNGKVRAQVQTFTPVLNASGCAAGQYGLGGAQYQNLSGTFTTAAVGSIGNYCNTVSSNGRVQPAATSTGQAQPIIYLTDTSTGYGTQWGSGSGPGAWMIMDRTSNSLNGGTFSAHMFNPMSIAAPMEIGSITLPASGVPYGSKNISILSGTDFTQFSSAAITYANSGGIRFTGPMTGTITNNTSFANGGFTYTGILAAPKVNGINVSNVNLLPQDTFQACQSGFGFVISPTSFMCIDTIDYYSTPHLFQQ